MRLERRRSAIAAAVFLAVVTVTASFTLSISAAAQSGPTIFDTASGATTSQGAKLNDRFWQLHRFEVTSTVTIGTVGGHISHGGCAPYSTRTAFAALVA